MPIYNQSNKLFEFFKTNSIIYNVQDTLKINGINAKVLFDTGNEGITVVTSHFYNTNLINNPIEYNSNAYGLGGIQSVGILKIMKPLIYQILYK